MTDCARIGTNSGHGHAWPRPDGSRMRCGGVRGCEECAMDQALVDQCRRETVMSKVPSISEGVVTIEVNTPAGLNDDTRQLIKAFAEEMSEKARSAEIKYGYSNTWKDPSWQHEWQCKMLDHVMKGDPRDVAIYCMFAHYHGWKTFDQSLGIEVKITYTYGVVDVHGGKDGREG